MNVAVEVVSAGVLASLQDDGRRGFRRVGVPWSGVLDTRMMRIANALVGNDAGAPVIEFYEGGLQLAARGGAVRVAVAGDAALEWERRGRPGQVSAWRSFTLADGDVCRVRRLGYGRIGVVAIEGLAVPPVLGSASTYRRAGLGGVDGRPLATGTRLPAAPATARDELTVADPTDRKPGPIRVVAGPQADHFAPATLAAFADAEYLVTTDADRMGVRLDGPALPHLGAPEIVSDATAPGSIQVPGTRQPIVLLADAQTAGGYPKIATVVGADLARVAAARPGDALRFAFVDVAEGERLARHAEADTLAVLARVHPVPASLDEAALYDNNLVTGMIDADAPDD